MKTNRHSLRNRFSANSIWCFLIALIVLLAYYPSLFHAPRADQILYLHFVDGIYNLKALTLDSYAFNRTQSGDFILFRPVLYFLLGFEKWLFGYNFWAWQLAGIVLHIFVLFALFLNLLIYCRGSSRALRIAFLVTLLFGVQYISMEMVVWHHISGYLLFTLFLLLSILFFQKYQTSSKPSDLAFCFAVTLVSSFTYELGNIVAFLYAVFTFFRLRGAVDSDKKQGIICFGPVLLFILVPIAYILASLADMSMYDDIAILLGHVDFLADSDGGSRSYGILSKFIFMAFYTFLYILIWFVGGIIPGSYTLIPGSRITLSTELQFSTIVIFIIILIIINLSLVFRGMTLDHKILLERKWEIFLLLAIICSYTSLIVYGRGMTRGFIATLSGNSYYSYVCNAVVFLLLFQVFSSLVKRSGITENFFKLSHYFLIFSLAFLIMLNTYKVYKTNEAMVTLTKPWLSTLNESYALIREHSDSQNFSFRVEDSCEANPVVTWFKDGDDTLSQIVFPNFYNTENPVHEISCLQILEGIESP